VQTVRGVVETAARIGLPFLTLYAFSAENWKKRPASEVEFLMQLLRQYLKQEVPRLNGNNVRLTYIGRLWELPENVQERLKWAEQQTAGNTGMVLTLALNYGARTEIVDAFRSIIEAARNNGGIDHLHIDEELVARHLYGSLPDPDLVIRTSGELRVSNFLLWQIAYAEIYVTSKLWPDFEGADLLHAIADYQRRERRYGGLGSNGNGHAHSDTLVAARK
jgi:undecaprenyl diphosphate synthase